MSALMNQLKLFRTRQGMTQEQVAEQVGVSRQAVAKWEKGETLPDIDSCIRLADLFSVPLDVLVRDLKEKKENGRQMAGCVKMNDKGQITLPAAIRDAFGFHAGDMVLVLADTERGIALMNLGQMADENHSPAAAASRKEEIK